MTKQSVLSHPLPVKLIKAVNFARKSDYSSCDSLKGIYLIKSPENEMLTILATSSYVSIRIHTDILVKGGDLSLFITDNQVKELIKGKSNSREAILRGQSLETTIGTEDITFDLTPNVPEFLEMVGDFLDLKKYKEKTEVSSLWSFNLEYLGHLQSSYNLIHGSGYQNPVNFYFPSRGDYPLVLKGHTASLNWDALIMPIEPNR